VTKKMFNFYSEEKREAIGTATTGQKMREYL
jgi:hypothetical protein